MRTPDQPQCELIHVWRSSDTTPLFAGSHTIFASGQVEFQEAMTDPYVWFKNAYKTGGIFMVNVTHDHSMRLDETHGTICLVSRFRTSLVQDSVYARGSWGSRHAADCHVYESRNGGRPLNLKRNWLLSGQKDRN